MALKSLFKKKQSTVAPKNLTSAEGEKNIELTLITPSSFGCHAHINASCNSTGVKDAEMLLEEYDVNAVD